MAGATPFFLLGADRSGTTLLRSLVESRFLAAVPPESEFVRDLAPPPGKTLDAAAAKRLWRRVRQHPRFRSWELSTDDLDAPGAGPGDEVFRALVESAFTAYARARGVVRWGDKTPSYLGSLDLLTRLWPTAPLVFLERDGRDVFCSVRPLPFGPNTARAGGLSWARAVRAGRRAKQRWPERVQIVRYEDLVTDPDAVLAALAAFLELEPRETALAGGTRVDRDRLDWFPRLRGAVDATSVDRWRGEMSPQQIADFESVAGAELVAAGYPLAATRPPSAAPARLAESVREAALRAQHFVTLRIWRERGREVGYVVRRRAHGWR